MQQLERYYADKPAEGKHHFFQANKDESATYALAQTTIGALEASRSLIVICSPAAATNYQVNEQIRAFKSHHPARPVFPLIVDGRPGDEERECFPPLLKFELDADGSITKGPLDIEATDVSQGKDEPGRAAAGIASNLLGLSSDKGAYSAPRGKRRSPRSRLASLMNLCIVLGLAMIVVRSGPTTNEASFDRTLYLAAASLGATAREAIDDGAPQTTVVRFLANGESVLWDVMKHGPLTPETKYRRATALLNFARTYNRLGDTERASTAVDDAQQLLLSLRSAEPHNAEFVRKLEIAEEALAAFLAKGERSADVSASGAPPSKPAE